MSTIFSGKFGGLVAQLVLMFSRGKIRKPGNEVGSSSGWSQPKQSTDSV